MCLWRIREVYTMENIPRCRSFNILVSPGDSLDGIMDINVEKVVCCQLYLICNTWRSAIVYFKVDYESGQQSCPRCSYYFNLFWWILKDGCFLHVKGGRALQGSPPHRPTHYLIRPVSAGTEGRKHRGNSAQTRGREVYTCGAYPSSIGPCLIHISGSSFGAVLSKTCLKDCSIEEKAPVYRSLSVTCQKKKGPLKR